MPTPINGLNFNGEETYSIAEDYTFPGIKQAYGDGYLSRCRLHKDNNPSLPDGLAYMKIMDWDTTNDESWCYVNIKGTVYQWFGSDQFCHFYYHINPRELYGDKQVIFQTSNNNYPQHNHFDIIVQKMSDTLVSFYIVYYQGSYTSFDCTVEAYTQEENRITMEDHTISSEIEGTLLISAWDGYTYILNNDNIKVEDTTLIL